MQNNSPVVSIRIPPLLLAAIDEYIADTNVNRYGPKLTRSTFLLLAADMELARAAERKKVVPITPAKPARKPKVSKVRKPKG